ncbi:Lytic transglycosylase catalytic [Thermaerobacter marianensis DSM 12885]|uniref:Lytic transglycosylase catalytic n=1 Tax=Thermaerobacter marianensis (strain ATCC 700841 / DSM 12885 / JCM 10246 / 7p75a) TaxID=644966 RepID=E6SGK4_THEM7|nr:lytic transglycosylase domain-containing protein [Thermaerobacter marianensis]ADU50550.1 Lytic transglycosylase catalytic [Thermaerobacter marianensis DSM 12885]
MTGVDLILGGGWPWLRWGAIALLAALVALAGFYAAYPVPMAELIGQEAAACGVDPLLVAAVVRRESGFEPRAVSDRGARGLMQIMPETGAWVAGQMGLPAFHPDRLFEPEYNLRLGCWYLAYLLERFHGDPVVALAAYNGGEGTVADWIARGRWHPQRGVSAIPYPETRRFVAGVLRDYRVYQWLYRRLPDFWGQVRQLAAGALAGVRE